MPISAGALAAITGGSQIAGNLIQNSGTKRSQKRADKMNIKFFNMQNEYNTPESQMARLKKAGLNPHLIYGSSVGGATGNAGSGPSPSKAAPYTMQGVGQSALSGYQAQADVNLTNLQAANEGVQLGVNKKYAQEIAEQELQNIRLGNAKKVIENNVASGIERDTILLAAENLANAKATLTGKQLSNAILEYQNKMKDMNIEGTGWMSTVLKFIMGNISDSNQGKTNPNPTDQGKYNKSGYIINRKKYPDQN